jgi:hypothetical protein
MDSPKARLHLGVDFAYGDDSTAVFILEDRVRTLHSTYSIAEKERSAFVTKLILVHKPTRVDILVGDNQHQLSDLAVQGVLSGRITEADLEI